MSRAASAWLALTCALATIASGVSAATDQPSFSKGRRFDERSGEALYRSVCQGCHQPDGQGARGAGVYPALAHDVNLASRQYPVAVLLFGRRNMPSFAGSLDDAQIAAVATYVRTHFGNDYGNDDGGAITAAEVGALRPPR